MQSLDATFLAAGNIHARCRVLSLRIKDAADQTVSPEAIAVLAEAMQRIRPVILDCPAWRRLTQARGDVPVAALVEVLALILQRYTHWPVKFCSWRERASQSHPGRTDQLERQGIAVFEIGAENPGRVAGEGAIALAELLMGQPSADEVYHAFLAQMTILQDRTSHETPSGDALQIAGDAARRGIAWAVMQRSQLMRLGLGRYSQILKGTESTHTRSIGRLVAGDKGLTNRILTEAGLPVPRQAVTSSLKRAQSLAEKVGYPLVVKPRNGNMGRGITIGVRDGKHLARAFERAQKVSHTVVLESLIEGEEYRLLAVGGRFVAAAHRRAAQVKGDGVSTITQLVERENLRPEREPVLISRMAILRRLELDDYALEVLAEQGMHAESIPEEGQIAYLRRESNISRGGEPADVTDRMHPDNIEMAGRAARIVGLDIAGIDFITTDPAISWRQNRAAICEVNSRPGINMQIQMAGKGRDRITGPILDMYFPQGSRSRMPVVALLGQPEQTRQLRESIEASATEAGLVLGLVGPAASPAHPDGTVTTRRLADADALAWDPDIDLALLEATPAEFVARGIGVERLDLAVTALSDGSEAHGLASETLSRVSGGRLVGLDDSAAAEQVGAALGLDLRQVASTPVPMSPQTEARANFATPLPRRAQDPDEVAVLFLGDLGFGESYMHRPRTLDLQRILGSFGHGYSLANLQDILGLGHFTIANLEVPLSMRPDPALQGQKNYLGWSDPERTAAALQQAGIDAVCLANNHMLDCGAAGLSDTLSRLQASGIGAFGAGEGEAAAAHPLIHRFEVAGAERSLVVFPGFEYRRRYDRRYRWYARGQRGGIGLLSPDAIAQQISALREVLPDPVFVGFPHWGTDYEDTTDAQRVTAAELVAAGLDLIIGHGAHVLQPIEMIEGVPVLYNIGNFVWNTPGRFKSREVLPMGAAVSLTFARNQRGGPRLRLYPIVTDNDLTGFQNRPVTEDEFPEVARFLTSRLTGRPRRMQDEAGFCLDLPLHARRTAEASASHVAAE